MYDYRTWFALDLDRLVPSAEKCQNFCAQFAVHRDFFDTDVSFNLCTQSAEAFIINVSSDLLLLPETPEEIANILGMLCPPTLLYREEEALLFEALVLTESLVELRGFSLIEQSHMERGFLGFVSNYRRSETPSEISEGSAVTNFFRACPNTGSLQIIQIPSCLCGVPQIRNKITCMGSGNLSYDITSSVFSTVLKYLVSQNIRSIDSIIEELLPEIVEANKRLMDSSDLTEESLWDDVGIVSGEKYRESIYARLVFLRSNERAASPEVGSGATYARAKL